MLTVRDCFERSALTYDQFSYPQQIIGYQLIELVHKYLHSAPLIADLGCGTGLLTQQLLKSMHFTEFHAFDIAARCVALAEERLTQAGVQVHHDDLRHLSRYERLFNLIFSNMTLHWNTALDAVIAGISANVVANGLVAFTLPITGTFAELRTRSKNAFYEYDAVLAACHQAGIEPLETFVESFTFTFPSWLHALKSIKATGANFLFARARHGLAGASTFQAQAFFNDATMDKFTLTYQICFFIGKKHVN